MLTDYKVSNVGWMNECVTVWRSIRWINRDVITDAWWIASLLMGRVSSIVVVWGITAMTTCKEWEESTCMHTQVLSEDNDGIQRMCWDIWRTYIRWNAGYGWTIWWTDTRMTCPYSWLSPPPPSSTHCIFSVVSQIHASSSMSTFVIQPVSLHVHAYANSFVTTEICMCVCCSTESDRQIRCILNYTSIHRIIIIPLQSISHCIQIVP